MSPIRCWRVKSTGRGSWRRSLYLALLLRLSWRGQRRCRSGLLGIVVQRHKGCGIDEAILIVTTAVENCDRAGAFWRRQIVYAAMTSLAMFALGGCDFPGRPKELNGDAASSQKISFESLFARNCAGCHGKDGYLGPAPPLNDALY